ncbi:venom carboxylesterase-6-like [Onthophagus taurus]|uniref:venom carboxylesterase-6-like n=1 Tax=Onthophagus taurus TaxID=166361 RepID=UPI0039BE9AA7
MYAVNIFLFFTILLGVSCENEKPSVQISTGIIRGFLDTTKTGKVYAAFEGIPYAKPPIGNLRFQPPEKISNWTDILEANKKYVCRYFLPNAPHLELDGLEITEDCLRLNVYVPNKNPSEEDNYSVVVHIHGGGFMIGHPHTLYGPKFLMDENVIFVSINYRLGPLGFLSTQDDVIPGNNGMKDQSMALKFIQENIKKFGGNPNSVLITGLSAGGASVHLHYFSPLSTGLFQKGYSASGTVLDPWVLQEAGFQKAKRLANLVGCKSENSKEILDCVRDVSYEKLFEATQTFLVHDMPFSPFAPIIEHHHPGAFLDKHPYELLLQGKVQDLPWLVGFSREDGIFPAGVYYHDMDMVNEDWLNFAPHFLDYNFTAPYHQKDLISTKIKEKYSNGKSITYHDLIKISGDRHFFRGSENSIHLQNDVTSSPIYTVMFAYRGQYSYELLFGVPDTERGVSHGDDTIYYTSTTVFGDFNEEDEKVRSVFTKMIASFAKTSAPHVDGVEWKSIHGDKIDYLYFDGDEDLKMKHGKDFGSIDFWKSLELNELP